MRIVVVRTVGDLVSIAGLDRGFRIGTLGI